MSSSVPSSSSSSSVPGRKPVKPIAVAPLKSLRGPASSAASDSAPSQGKKKNNGNNQKNNNKSVKQEKKQNNDAGTKTEVQQLKFEDAGMEVAPNMDKEAVWQNNKKRRHDEIKSKRREDYRDAAKQNRSRSKSHSNKGKDNTSTTSTSTSTSPSTSHKKPMKKKQKFDIKPSTTTEEVIRTHTKGLSKEEKTEYLEKFQQYKKTNFQTKDLQAIDNKRLKRDLIHAEERNIRAAESAIASEILLPAQSGYLMADENSVVNDQTWRISQQELAEHVDQRTRNKIFDLKLGMFGPYRLNYTRNGRHLLLAGAKGHITLMDWQKFSLTTEFHVKETIRDIKFLHNEQMFAVAQKKYVYIYDNTGVELHCLRNHFDVNVMQFLPYHFLLATIGKTGYLKYQDTSTGQFLLEHRTRKGECNVMTQNPSNAVIHCGHHNGQMTLWTPNMTDAVVTVLCHKAPILAMDVDRSGKYAVTSGLDGQVKIWDLRTYKLLHEYFTVRPCHTIDISDSGMMALGYGPHIQIWKDAFVEKPKAPYMNKEIPGELVQNVEFCPYEDVLGIGHSGGFSSIVIPGAGEANFDSWEANPFQTKAQRREHVVHMLLDKIQPDMISLDSQMFGTMNEHSKTLYQQQRSAIREAENDAIRKKNAEKDHARGKGKSSKQARRRRANIVEKLDSKREQAIKEQEQEKRKKLEEERKASGKQTLHA